MALEALKNFIGIRNVMVFAQPPDPSQGFVPLLLSQVSIPSPTRAAFNLSDTENLTRSWAMTRNPVERIVAQNRIELPKVLRVTGMISADPMFSPLGLVGIARLDRLELAKLIQIVSRSTCFVVTPERAYPNMGCTVLDETYDMDTGRGVRLSMVFEEFQIARPGVTAGEFDVAVAEIGALDAVDLGNTVPAEVPTTSAPISSAEALEGVFI
jgi:hypothetical protein